jgi:hypothetical protein
MKELEHYNQWLLEHKSIDLTDIYEDYKIELKQTVKTLDDVLEYLCVLSDITKFQLLTDYGKGKRGGSNKIPRVRGYLVKAVLSLNTDIFNSQNVYKKLFNIVKDHSTALHFKSYTEFFGKELEIYNKILNYIKTYDIQWEP